MDKFRTILRSNTSKTLMISSVLRIKSAFYRNICVSGFDKFAKFTDRTDWTTVTDNGSTIVCWHPEKSFPYEHTKPLPNVVPEMREGDSVLKVQYRLQDKYRFKPSGPSMPELQKLTATSKHRWYPKPEKKYRKPNPPKDRDGL